MTNAIGTAPLGLDIRTPMERPQFRVSLADPFAVSLFHAGDHELSERIAAFNQTNNDLEVAERRAAALRRGGDDSAAEAEARVDQLLWLATARLKTIFEFQPATLRGAIELLLCSINASSLERENQDVVMDNKACARALSVIQELTGIERKLPW